MESYVDCSDNNGAPDLQAYWNAGHRFLMFKATEGAWYAWATTPRLPGFAELVRRWHQLGGRAGYYHWLYATSPARVQHDWFWSHVAPVFQPGDETMADFEDSDPARWRDDATHLAVLSDFNADCAALAPHTTYTGNWYLANLPQCRNYLRDQPVVIADYANDPPLNPYGLRHIVAHQRTSAAKVPGFAGLVDYNTRLQPTPTPSGDDDVPYNAWPAADRAAFLADVKTVVDERIVARLGGTGTRVKDFYENYLTNDYLVHRIALAIGGALDGVPSTGHNLPGTERVISAHIDQAIGLVLAAVQADAPAAPVIDIAALAGAVRDEIAKRPLTLSGTVEGAAK